MCNQRYVRNGTTRIIITKKMRKKMYRYKKKKKIKNMMLRPIRVATTFIHI
jgi:hypothetical protein